MIIILTMGDDISITLTCLLMKVAGLWLASNAAEQRLRWLTLTYTVGMLSLGLYVNFADICNTLDDISNVLYGICNVTFVIVGSFKFVVLFLQKAKFVNLVQYTECNFWHSNYDPQEKILLAECRRIFTFIIVFAYCILNSSLANYILTPLIMDYGKNQSERSLPFNTWVDLPLTVSPYYEITFIIQILCLAQVGVCHICFDTFLSLINFHLAYQFRILQYRLKNLWECSDKDRDLTDYINKCHVTLKKCVRQHQALIQYCEKVNDIYSLNVLAFVLALSLLICLTMYQVLMVDTTLTMRVTFILLTFGSFVEIVMFTYSCDLLIQESRNVGLTIYSVGWTNLPMNKIGKSLRSSISIMILRANQPCYITAGGFFPMSLEISTTVFSTAISYFTLLTNSTQEDE
ncbi:odorant receptor 49b-like isoform X1 [Hylaeus anthracinus]|uniref:odorant receptor 49b-like isoform X1 n=1 Tax=Hylaeus anthracinus TaxID=313031 RepID=UPI0023B8DDB2|nr:odorant receptor 49b-like isoform X1 [Hylaeus anthracinus]